MKVQAYLSFKGNCQEALNYYSDLFEAEVINRQTYEDKKIDVPSSYRNNLQHAELKGKNIYFMAYDVSPDTPLNSGNQIHMSVEFTSVDEGRDLFDKLSSGGQIHHNYREREWGYFGRCTDKFGIGWMVNHNI
ncbi:VOC family protein [Bizionia gelidisalsuginis]|uniref:VOC family protein n=2 Tax=Bizionia TaxID=283785 RepID=A0A8H2QED4_9FLAO|nr:MULTISPECIES: VOC family protein [Bizionia]TYB71819.1 VOC family protein [Bizionia saleffrena]TYC09584.1 VOC family protein [Bizionia gelidisalsuginis]